MGLMHVGLERWWSRYRTAAFYAERAKGGVALIVTGAFYRMITGDFQGGSKLDSIEEAEKTKVITQAVHDAGGKIAMQILHTGRYSIKRKMLHPLRQQAPINPGMSHCFKCSSSSVDDCRLCQLCQACTIRRL